MPHEAVQMAYETGKTADERQRVGHEAIESGRGVKMNKHELITMIENAGLEAVERDTVYNRVAAV